MILLFARRLFRGGTICFGSKRSLMTEAMVKYLSRIEGELGADGRSTGMGSILDPRKTVEVFRNWRQLKASLASLQSLCKAEEHDATMLELLHAEIEDEKQRLRAREEELRKLITSSPEDSLDSGGAVMEIRAGTGGVEASAFAMEMLDMYQKYISAKGWASTIRSQSWLDDNSGLRELTVSIDGVGVFGKLKWEKGVHRVQRVPESESQGRIHTSTVTIAILPPAPNEALEKVQLNDADLRFESFKSSGPGGQHVNKTNSAVRVTHIPTGIAVAVQEERCAQQNRARALAILAERLTRRCKDRVEVERRTARQAQIGSAARSEKIRTYNFPQGRITDHRLGRSLHDLDAFFAGRCLDTLIDAMTKKVEDERLEALLGYVK